MLPKDMQLTVALTFRRSAQLILYGNFLIYLFLLAYTPYDIESAYQLLETFHQSL
jgi:hypothetical protein